MARRPVIGGNWKMNLGGISEAEQLAKGLVSKIGSQDQVEVILCPPATAIAAVARVVENSSLFVGGQNIYPEAKGAFTGEISAEFLKSLGCTHCIVGHSERRHIFGEPDELINRKVHFLLQTGLMPILCCGETEEERKQGITEDVVRRHIEKGLQGISDEQMNRVIIAYEPVWAIGTGLTAEPEDAEAVHSFLRTLLKNLYNEQVAENVRIQYGGSVKADNAAELMAKPNIDGALVGGASLKVDSFVGIVEGAC